MVHTPTVQEPEDPQIKLKTYMVTEENVVQYHEKRSFKVWYVPKIRLNGKADDFISMNIRFTDQKFWFRLIPQIAWNKEGKVSIRARN